MLGLQESLSKEVAMRRPAKSVHLSVDPLADFCGEVESYAVTGAATSALDRLCGQLWNCSDTLPTLACNDADVPQGSAYAAAARRIRRAIRHH
jgi:hypothetical protein